jgi:hypothetical protein
LATAASIQDAITRTEDARLAKIEGRRVIDVWRDGRRVRYSDMSLKEIEDALSSLNRDLEAAIAVEAGKSRRSRISVYY